MKPVIKTKNVSLIYNLGKSYETNALLDINIEIYPEEYIIIYGPSGCGKSTLLYSLSGLQKPTKGQIWVKNKELLSLIPKERVNIHLFEIGMIFQAYYLVPSLSIFDNVILPQVFSGGSVEKRKKKAEDLLEHFGILKQSSKFPSELSGGQKQRVSIARAMMNDPSIIMADEPVGNLDSKSTKVVMDLLEELNSKFKKTILLVTHDSRFLHYAHRVFYMKDGKIIKEVRNDKKRIKTIQDKTNQTENQLSDTLNQLAKVYPNLTYEQLQAKAITQHLLIDFTSTEIFRLEKAIEKRIAGEINTSELERMLDDSFQTGGVGLYKQTAKNFAQKIDTVISVANFLRQQIQIKDKKYSDFDMKIIEMRKYILDNSDYDGLSLRQIKRLEKFIGERLKKTIIGREFEQRLDLAYDKGGVGLNSRTAKHFTRELELVLTQ